MEWLDTFFYPIMIEAGGPKVAYPAHFAMTNIICIRRVDDDPTSCRLLTVAGIDYELAESYEEVTAKL